MPKCRVAKNAGLLFCRFCGTHFAEMPDPVPDCRFWDRFASGQADRSATALPSNIPAMPVTVAAEKLGVSLSDVAHYGRALARWTAAGFPERSDAEVARLVAICKACPKYVAGRCSDCRCRVSEGPAVVNKIRMATENCPKEKWQPIASSSGDS